MSSSTAVSYGRLHSPLGLTAVGKAAEAIPLVLLVTVVPRLLGPADYGRVALAVSIVTLGSAAASLGGPILLTRFVPAAEPARRSGVARALAQRLALWRGLQLMVLILAASALTGLVPTRFPPLITLLVVVALSLDVAATLCFQVALGLGRDRLWTFRYALQNSVLVTAVLALAVTSGHHAAVAGVAVASGAALLVGAVATIPELARAQPGASVPHGAFRFGLIQGVGSFFVQVVHRGGVAAVALLAASSRQTGFAGLAIGVALAATYAVWQAFAIQLPRLASNAADDPQAANAAAERLAWTTLLIAGPAAIVAAALLEPALPVLAGERFRGAEAALAPALALVALAPLSALVVQAAILRLRADVRLWASACGAVVFIAVAAAAVPSLGAAGATTALLLGTLAAGLASAALLPGSASPRVLTGSIAAAAAALLIGEVTRGALSSSLLVRSSAAVIGSALGVLALRRIVLLVAAILPPRQIPATDGASVIEPSVALVVAAHNEAGCVERLLAALERLEYPEDRLSILLIDDGSTDGTGDIFARWAERRPNATAIQLAVRAGKPSALNHALRVAASSELIGVCDADHEPHPDSLRRVVAAFADETVGAAGAFIRPVNADAGLVARYAAVEAWVTQLVTSAARSRLDLNPPMLGGGAVYRRRALDEIGGFPGGLISEDAGATIAITGNGWRTRFVRDAVVDNRVVEHGRAYWHQHIRWARTGYETMALQRGSSASIGRKLEAWMVSAGYSDRIALLAAAAFAAVGALPIWVPAGYLGVIGLAIVVAVARGGELRRLPLYLVSVATMLVVDAAATVYAGALQLRRRPPQWRTPRPARAPDG